MSDTLPVVRFPDGAIVTPDGEPVALADAALFDLVDWRERVLREAADLVKARLAEVDDEIVRRCVRAAAWKLNLDGWTVEARQVQPKLYESNAAALRKRLEAFVADGVIDQAAVDKCVPLEQVARAKIGALRQLSSMAGFDVADAIADAIPEASRRVVVTPAPRSKDAA